MGDALLMFHLSRVGKVKYIPKMMTVYRIAMNSAMSLGKNEKVVKEKMFDTLLRLAENNGYLNLKGELVQFRNQEQKQQIQNNRFIAKTIRVIRSLIYHIWHGDFWQYWLYTRQSPIQRVHFFGKKHKLVTKTTRSN